MAALLNRLSSKKEVDRVIKSTEDKVLVLRFGKESDSTCLKLDDILAKNQELVSNMAVIYTVDSESVPVYMQYFDIVMIPSTVFFFNGQHMKVDWGTADHTKFVGAFKNSQDFIDVVEVIYRGAMKGKFIVTSPLDRRNVQQFNLIYNDI
ncbi:PREDICTED: thioredoxin-like protein 4B [Amphimedon queenslandica]|uniref:Thioredoxin-like protein n=1 Tax=Amphimedon queenslandica TaxID=400682 RepID=A0AAN0IHJ9_AMPQE|nr:PREDICTED: thioredoxin-like protein 4B [Amphimedon queenslandica]|eukprot:XP_003389540.1 PREDICTED: thioredoxin-like protein 4B [Amphimedon queenslandica]